MAVGIYVGSAAFMLPKWVLVRVVLLSYGMTKLFRNPSVRFGYCGVTACWWRFMWMDLLHWAALYCRVGGALKPLEEEGRLGGPEGADGV